ncbi:MAG: hypothetical protein ACRDP1_05785 [Nocardioidaceae bacterium]
MLTDPHLLWAVDATASFSRHGVADQTLPLRRFAHPGRQPGQRWFRSPVGPGLERQISTGPGSFSCVACRFGDYLGIDLPLWQPAATPGTSFVFADHHTGSWALRRGSRRIARGADFIGLFTKVPPAPARYTLSATSVPDLPGLVLSNHVSDVWGFRSGHGRSALPLMMPSYAPPVRINGRAVAARIHFRLAFPHTGPRNQRVSSAHAAVSYDNGRHWSPVPLTRLDGDSFRMAYQDPPASHGRRFASLRVSATDSAGNTVRETALQTYRLLPRRTMHAAVTHAQAHRPARSVARLINRVATRPQRVCRSLPGSFHCFAILDKVGAAARTASQQPAGYGPAALRGAYGLTPGPSAGQTVAIVDAYDDPNAEHDLAVYRRQYGLPACTTANGCFTKVNQNGRAGRYPAPDAGWGVEISLDLQMVSAACPDCKIVLVEASQPDTRDLGIAADTAARLAPVTSHSYGIAEFTGVHKQAKHWRHPGSTTVVSTGDNGYQPAAFPASIPQVISPAAPGSPGPGRRVVGASGPGTSPAVAAPDTSASRPSSRVPRARCGRSRTCRPTPTPPRAWLSVTPSGWAVKEAGSSSAGPVRRRRSSRA